MIFCWVKRQAVNKEEPKNVGLPTSSTRFESCPPAFAHLLCNQKEFRMENRMRHSVFWIDGPLDSQMHGLPKWHSGKESTCWCRRCKRRGFDPWVGKIPWSRQRQPAPVFLSEKSHGQRSLVDYSPWGCRELDMTEHAVHNKYYIYMCVCVCVYNEIDMK